jgi:hypothetical protein
MASLKVAGGPEAEVGSATGAEVVTATATVGSADVVAVAETGPFEFSAVISLICLNKRIYND